MYKVIRADKDAYITDRVIKGERAHAANTGESSSLDLFKLYGITSTGSLPNIELSRLLIHFNLDPIRSLVTNKKIDITNPTFSCKLKLFDVDGGQTVPANFTVVINPLSRSFDEGFGRDVVLYEDNDVCNFLTGSRADGSWILSGANSGGHNSLTHDYLTTATLNAGISSSLEVNQLFTLGTEDLNVDITRIVSATLANIIPDKGFRIAFSASHETDTRTYFVKRFASRHAYNEDFHPQLIFTFDNSVQDDTAAFYLDSSSSMFVHNFESGRPTNFLLGTTRVTGSNSLIFRLETAISGGFSNFVFTGSQYLIGSNPLLPVSGVYSASVHVSQNNAVIKSKLQISSSILFTPIWGSLDGTVGYFTGSSIRAFKPVRGSSQLTHKQSVSVLNVNPTYFTTDEPTFKLMIFDAFSPNLIATKVPIANPGLVIRDAHYQIRNVQTDKIIIPFDSTLNSTRVSSDSEGMYFKVDMSNLVNKRTYIIDIMITTNGQVTTYKNASAHFTISDPS